MPLSGSVALLAQGLAVWRAGPELIRVYPFNFGGLKIKPTASARGEKKWFL